MTNKIIAEARGQWVGDKSYYPNSWGWNINMSSILTELIHYAGRYVDKWASDLFITWTYKVENRANMTDQNWKDTIYIGFREWGVDDSAEPWGEGNRVFDQRNENLHYYRRIVKLEIGPDKEWGNDYLSMILTEVA